MPSVEGLLLELRKPETNANTIIEKLMHLMQVNPSLSVAFVTHLHLPSRLLKTLYQYRLGEESKQSSDPHTVQPGNATGCTRSGFNEPSKLNALFVTLETEVVAASQVFWQTYDALSEDNRIGSTIDMLILCREAYIFDIWFMDGIVGTRWGFSRHFSIETVLDCPRKFQRLSALAVNFVMSTKLDGMARFHNIFEIMVCRKKTIEHRVIPFGQEPRFMATRCNYGNLAILHLCSNVSSRHHVSSASHIQSEDGEFASFKGPELVSNSANMILEQSIRFPPNHVIREPPCKRRQLNMFDRHLFSSSLPLSDRDSSSDEKEDNEPEEHPASVDTSPRQLAVLEGHHTDETLVGVRFSDCFGTYRADVLIKSSLFFDGMIRRKRCVLIECNQPVNSSTLTISLPDVKKSIIDSLLQLGNGYLTLRGIIRKCRESHSDHEIKELMQIADKYLFVDAFKNLLEGLIYVDRFPIGAVAGLLDVGNILGNVQLMELCALRTLEQPILFKEDYNDLIHDAFPSVMQNDICRDFIYALFLSRPGLSQQNRSVADLNRA